MFLTNQIAQLRVLDFTYTTSRAVSRRRKPPRTLILPTANTYTTHREHLYYSTAQMQRITHARFERVRTPSQTRSQVQANLFACQGKRIRKRVYMYKSNTRNAFTRLSKRVCTPGLMKRVCTFGRTVNARAF